MIEKINTEIGEETIKGNEEILVKDIKNVEKKDNVIELPVEENSNPKKRKKHLAASDKSVEDILQELISKPSEEEKAKVKLVQEDLIRGTRIKKSIELPKNRRDRRKKLEKDNNYENKYAKKRFNVREKKPLKRKIILNTFIIASIVLLFRNAFNIDMSFYLDKYELPLIAFSGLIFAYSAFLVLGDKTSGKSDPDPITDFFIVSKGKATGNVKKDLENKINTRFIMVTFLKLYQRGEIAIINERIIYGAMDSKITEDEIVLLDFLLDNKISTLDDFLALLEKENPVKHLGVLNKSDRFYEEYKKTIIKMAEERKYINRSVKKAKRILRGGGTLFAIIVLGLLAKGQATLMGIALYSTISTALFLAGNLINARSKGANIRISEMRREKKSLMSLNEDIYTSLIYNYLFAKEEKVLRQIDKLHRIGSLSTREYKKFCESFNSFDFMLDSMKCEKK